MYVQSHFLILYHKLTLCVAIVLNNTIILLFK